MIMKTVRCPTCGGSGKIKNWTTHKEQTCNRCHGSGTITQIVTPKEKEN
jgi:DnaJ-class molecular chaperone